MVTAASVLGVENNAHFIELVGKAAKDKEWQTSKTAKPRDQIKGNAGLLLEHAGLTDIDLDSPEIKAILPRFVPTNTLTIGRGASASHYLYAGELPNDEDMKDLGGHKMVEVRHKGKQVMWVGSMHPDPPHETIEVMNDVAPLPVPDHEDVLKAYTAAVIAKYLPTGDRHNLAMAYAGYLLRQGLTETEVCEILEAAWTYHNAPHNAFNDLLSIVSDTQRKIDLDKPATGGNTLTLEIPGMVEALAKAWGWDRMLTLEEKQEVERQERVSKSDEAWQDPKVQKIARSYDILDKFRTELKAAGIVGVDRQLKLLFVAGHSRLLDKPMSVAVKGPSSSGKSKAVESAILNVQPDDAYIFRSGGSEKSLIYSDDDYRHKLLVMAEQAGVDSDFQDYIQRTLISEGIIKYPVTEKIDGRYKVTEKVKEGPTGLITTTTRAKLHPENETRILSIHTTDTREHIKEINRAQANDNRREMDTEPWKRFGTWLAGRDNRVSVPYSPALAELIEVYDERQSRDFPLLLSTIKTLAILHQAKRQRDHKGRIVANLHDYEIARDLLQDILSQGVGVTVSEAVRATVKAVKKLTNNGAMAVNSNAVMKHLNLSKGATSDRVRNALASGYVVDAQEHGKKGYMLLPGNDLPEDKPLLPEPADVLNASACNIVRMVRSISGMTLAVRILPLIVRVMVRPMNRTIASVQEFEKSYDEVFSTNRAYIRQPEAREEHTGAADDGDASILSEPTELPELCYKIPEIVTSDDSSTEPNRTTEPPDRTMLQVRSFYCDHCDTEREFLKDEFGDYECQSCGNFILGYEVPERAA